MISSVSLPQSGVCQSQGAAEDPRRRVRVRVESGGLKLQASQVDPGTWKGEVSTETRLLVHTGAPARVETRFGPICASHVATPGDMTLIPAGSEVVWNDRDPCETVTLWLSPQLLSRAAEGIGLRSGSLNFEPKLQERDPQVYNICGILVETFETEASPDAIYVDSLAMALASRVVRRYAGTVLRRPVAALPPKRLKLTLQFIEEHLDEELRLAALAKVAGLSPSHFAVLFRGAVGQSVHKYVITRRVNRARELLSSGNASIAEAAQASGFCHQSHLARRMREVLGLTPADIIRLA